MLACPCKFKSDNSKQRSWLEKPSRIEQLIRKNKQKERPEVFVQNAPFLLKQVNQ